MTLAPWFNRATRATAGGRRSSTCDVSIPAAEASAVAAGSCAGRPLSLEELAGQYGVSRERVRQIEVRAFEKLQKAMQAAAVEKRLVEA